MNPISEVLNKAADLLEPEGAWCKGTYEKDSACCVDQAIFLAARKNPGVWNRAKDKLAEQVNCNVVFWNDAPERTQAEVIQALRRAAQLANESQGREA